MSKLQQNLALMSGFLNRGQVQEVTDLTDNKHRLTLATQKVMGESKTLDNFLTPALQLIPSTEIDDIVLTLEKVLAEYKRLGETIEETTDNAEPPLE